MNCPIKRKERVYETPRVEIVDAGIEEGFAASGAISPGGDDGEEGWE